MLLNSPHIIFEDGFLLAIYKPALVHSVSLPDGTGGRSVADWLREQYPKLVEASEKPEDCGLIQRLDFETSGVIMGAKTREIWKLLREDLLAGNIAKKYLALLDGKLEGSKQIESFIGTPKRRGKRVYSYKEDPNNNTRVLRAKTIFKPVKFNAHANVTLCEVSAAVARRHQIRLHASELGYPLCGDALYGSERLLSNVIANESDCIPQFFLHSFSISIVHPVTKAPLCLEALPPDFIAKAYRAIGGQS